MLSNKLYCRTKHSSFILAFLLLLGTFFLYACTEAPVSVEPDETLSADTDPTTLRPYEEREISVTTIPHDKTETAGKVAAGVSVLVFGDRGGERAQLGAVLTSLGHTVTNVATLPLDLSPFQTVWHVGAFAPLTAAEQARLAAFLAGGGGVHLTGERPCCEPLNASLATLINAVVVGGGITVGGLGDFLPQGPFFTFNPGAVGGITTTPNALLKWSPAAPGGMAGLAASNILVTHDATGTPNGTVWECADLVGGDGHLSILMDVNWLNPSFNPPASRDPEIDNIQTFLERDCAVEPEINKDLLEGPEQIGIYLPGPTQYIFEIVYSGPAALIEDTVPAEFECVGQPVATDGPATCEKKGKSGKSANRIKWDAPEGSNTLTVTIQTVVSPGKRNNKKDEPPVFKPTSCGPLPINDGATAFEVDENGELVLVEVVDPETGEITLEPVVIVGPSNSLEVEAVAGAKPCEEG